MVDKNDLYIGQRLVLNSSAFSPWDGSGHSFHYTGKIVTVAKLIAGGILSEELYGNCRSWNLGEVDYLDTTNYTDNLTLLFS